ncbi:hypothetical protein [Nocardia sp. XZ_19_385]|uniref:hypothetical protein n=1 Tax=Nocardia sp. XZ_19_385 TaxID=2769488 RepID=UPI0018902555|nr:hypothetical protein [Nocardia sp. XZ_19_385]
MTIRNHSAPTLRTVYHRAVHLLRRRQRLTPQERANLLAGWTPPAVLTASLGASVHH